jgi:rod shape-determining protein MreD
MIRNLLAIFVLVLAVVMQTSVLPVHVATPFKPDLLLIAMVYLALRGSIASGALLSWLLGLVKDVFSGLYLGLNAFSFLIIFLVITSISDLLYAESSELFVVTVTAATLACVTANLVLLLLLTATPGISYSMTSSLLPHLLANAFAASLVTLLPVFSSPQEVI